MDHSITKFLGESLYSSMSDVDEVSTAAGDPIHNELYDIPTWMATLLAIVYFSVALFAVLGNWMVLWIVIRSKVMRNVTNIFIANLALADIMIGALAIPFQFQAALLQKWILKFFMCSFCPMIQVVSLNVSIFTLVAISVDRHRAVTRPLKPHIRKGTAYFIVSGIWMVSILASIPTFLAFKITVSPPSPSPPALRPISSPQTGFPVVSLRFSTEPNENAMNLVGDYVCWPTGLPPDVWKTYNHVLVFLQYILPFTVIFFTCIHMTIVLSCGPGIINETRGESDRVSQSKRRVCNRKPISSISQSWDFL
jgi:leucokinin receptor